MTPMVARTSNPQLPTSNPHIYANICKINAVHLMQQFAVNTKRTLKSFFVVRANREKVGLVSDIVIFS